MGGLVQNKFVTKRLPTGGIKLNPIGGIGAAANNTSHVSSYNSNFNWWAELMGNINLTAGG